MIMFAGGTPHQDFVIDTALVVGGLAGVAVIILMYKVVRGAKTRSITKNLCILIAGIFSIMALAAISAGWIVAEFAPPGF